MNRLFGTTGLIATGMNLSWVWFLICLPWLHIYGSDSPSASRWLIWGVASLAGVAILFAFMRYSLKAHWAALRHNAPIPPAAWRGVCGSYLLAALALALPVLSGDPSGAHRGEMYFYKGLAALAFGLGIFTIKRGFRRTCDRLGA